MRFLISSKVRPFVYIPLAVTIVIVVIDQYRSLRQRVAIERLESRDVDVEHVFIPKVAWHKVLSGEAPVYRLSNTLGTSIQLGRVELSRRMLLDTIPYVRNCTQLSSHASGNDALLEAASHLPKLDRLYLSESSVTDGGLEYLAEMPSLTDLDLESDRISAAGLARLAELATKRGSSLRLGLGLDGPDIGDAEVRILSAMASLSYLRLRETSATDESLVELGKIPSLWFVELSSNAGITKEGVQRLLETRPRLHVLLDGQAVKP